MANAPNGKNVLSKFETLQPVDGKISFFDPETGRIIKVKIGKPKKSRLFSFFSLKRKSKPTTGEQATVGEVCGAYSEGEEPDYYNDQQSGAAAPSAITTGGEPSPSPGTICWSWMGTMTRCRLTRREILTRTRATTWSCRKK
ncbi:uncharacterized protein LOC110985029 [Acanthaster planci]|uniref:Uncharacterized protein LOC110985029 n=1 Tax=Acanthaster planci TaxID=133434 RepID=A0A8B7Z8Y6_ACAPL|nr:uncharacterized protein LOC110985029 [Acanthaster planci]